MAETVTNKLSQDEAKAAAKEAINGNATKVVAKRQSDGKWILTITKP